MNYYPYMTFNTNELPPSFAIPNHHEESERAWLEWEDQRLKMASEKFLGKGWRKISLTAFPDGSRTKEECLKRWRVLTKSVSVKGLWTAEEDAQLTSLVQELGAEKWVAIASRLTTRTGKQCRERWHNHLDPRINKAPFTQEEEAKIFELHEKMGSKWAEMAKSLPGRSDNSIKNFYNTSMQRKRKLANDDSPQSESKHMKDFSWSTKDKSFLPMRYPLTPMQIQHNINDHFLALRGLTPPETPQQRGLGLDCSLDIMYSPSWSYQNQAYSDASPHLPQGTFEPSPSLLSYNNEFLPPLQDQFNNPSSSGYQLNLLNVNYNQSLTSDQYMYMSSPSLNNH